MKKIMITMMVLSSLLISKSYGESGAEFSKIRPKILSSYGALEESAHKMSLIYEQDVSKMVEMDRWIFYIVKSDLQIGGLVIKEILALHNLQAVQESTLPEAIEILTKASMDGIKSLEDLEARLIENGDLIAHKKGKTVIDESILVVRQITELLESLSPSKE